MSTRSPSHIPPSGHSNGRSRQRTRGIGGPWDSQATARRKRKDLGLVDRIRMLDPVRIGAVILILVSISRIHAQFPFMSAIRPGLLGAGIAFGWGMLDPRSIRSVNLITAWQARAVGILILCGLASIAFGISVGSSGLHFIRLYWTTIMETVLFLIVVRNIRDLRIVVGAYVASTALWVQTSLRAPEWARVDGRLEPLAGGWDSNDLGVILVVGAGFTLVWLAVERGILRVLPMILMVGILWTVTATGSRGAFVGLVAFGATLLVTLRSVSIPKRAGFAVLLVALLTATAGPTYWERMQTLLNPGEDYNVTQIDGRVPLMKRGLGYIIRYPVFGVGMNNFGRAEWQLSNKSWVVGNAVKWTAPHNTYLQVATEMGIPAFTIWMSLMFSGIFGSWRLSRRLPRWWIHSDRDRRFLFHLTEFMPSVFMGFAVSTMFLSFAYISPAYYLFALLANHRVLLYRALREDRARWYAWVRAHQEAQEVEEAAPQVPVPGQIAVPALVGAGSPTS